MEMNINDENKFVEIWLTRKESRDAELKEQLCAACRYFKRLKYFTAIYESGDGDLLQSVTALLRHNMELTVKAAE